MIVIDPRSLKVTVTWSLIALNNLKILVPRSNFERARNERRTFSHLSGEGNGSELRYVPVPVPCSRVARPVPQSQRSTSEGTQFS